MAKRLRELGVKGILITAAESGYITEVKCGMPNCRCPEELGGASHFVALTKYSDWNPTHEHYPCTSSPTSARRDRRRVSSLTISKRVRPFR